MGFLDALNVYEQHKYINDRYILFIYVVIIYYRPIQFLTYQAKEHFITYEA